MAELKYFSPLLKWLTAVADEPTDPDADPQIKGIYGGCTITVSIAGTDPRSVRVEALSPSPALISLAPIEARLDEGVLKLNASTQLRLVANCPVLALPEDVDLWYTFRFHHVTYNGAAQELPSITMTAPFIAEGHDDGVDGEVEKNLATAEWINPGLVAGREIFVRNVPDEVTLVDDALVFTHQDVPVGTPVDISGLVFNGTMDSIDDATPVGKQVARAASAASARTVIDAERATQFDVRNFGAAGDATHDDTGAIQAAINAAASAGGGRVLLPMGEHKITGVITMRSGVELSGAGPLSVLKPALPTGDVNRAIDNDWSTGSTGITLRNFKIDRSGAVLSHVMIFNGVDGLLVDGIEVSGGPATALGAGVLAISAIGPTTRLLSKNVRVVNNQFNDCGNYGVQVGYIDGCVIANNTAENSFREVFGVEPEAGTTAKNVVISGNHVTASATINGSITGVIDVTEASGGTLQGVTITGNVIRQINGGNTGQLGIYIVGESGGVSITGNSISGMDGPGIGVGNFALHTSDIVITGNTVTDCAKSDNTKPGIYLRNGSRCTIVGNAVYGTNHAASIIEQLDSSDNTIAFNSLRDTVPVVTLGVGTVVFGNKSVDGDSALHLGTGNTPSPSLVYDGTGVRRTEYRNGGLKRWRMDVGGTETGANSVGSDITFVSFDDTGAAAGTALTVKRAGRRVVTGGSLGVFRRASASNYAVVSSDCLVAITDTSAARTVTLPNAATEFEAGTVLIIADESGGAGTNNITINPKAGSGQTIDGASSIVISKNYGLVQLYSTGTNWKVLHNRYAEALKTPRTISGVSFDGSADINVTTPKTIGPAYFPSGYLSGNYYFTTMYPATSTSATLTNGVARALPWVVTDTLSITRLFCEFTAAGDAASVYRMGIWNHDPTTGKPGTLLVDAGSISTGSGDAGDVATGGTPGVYERTLSQVLAPGVYWVGGAVQGVTTTQPTLRTVTGNPVQMPLGVTLPGAGGSNGGAALAGQTGALGSMAGCAFSTTFPARIGFKTA